MRYAAVRDMLKNSHQQVHEKPRPHIHKQRQRLPRHLVLQHHLGGFGNILEDIPYEDQRHNLKLVGNRPRG